MDAGRDRRTMPGSDPAGSLALPVLDAFVPVLRSVTFDCHDPDVLADLWAATGCGKEASPEPGGYAVISDLSRQGRHSGPTGYRSQQPGRTECTSI